ncbi:MAG: beta-1,4-mannosyl-glycoprotein beta-1,4-N-acetylglucosaminyltransferase [Pelagibacterales bacterium]|nr:beta-1,4-mannosyl-glycoprotein beta-1,4-N-acetylglucosaminyltransferase [Pelagibacterales bacterium]
MYFDEDIVLDLRLNYLENFVDKFVIVESTYNHKGEKRKPQFDINKFSRFKDKINYILINEEPLYLETINDNDSTTEKSNKYINNASKRENYQRNKITEGLKDASYDDWILISDLDEIPNLEKNNLKEINEPIIFFRQYMMYYKFNLILENYTWAGTRACRKKDLKTPQWLRNIKDRSYPWWRLDTYFSINKYNNIKMINDGGWHFSYIKSPENIEKKLKSYLHHLEYDLNPMGIEKIKERVNSKRTIYNLKADMRSNKFDDGNELKKIKLNLLPTYISKNRNKLSEWIED